MKLAKVEGKGGISVEMVCYSKNEFEERDIMTFRFLGIRFVHAEYMTHRLFSRNASSSRAIPVASMIKQVRETPAAPIHWGKNQSGMQAKEELGQPNKVRVQSLWQDAADRMATIAEEMSELGAHKQIVNRLLEPFQYINVVMTTTEIANFLHLRNHPDAQPEIQELARCIYECILNSEPQILGRDDWHVPFVEVRRGDDGKQVFFDEDGFIISLDDALKISASCCAQVSYRKSDASLEKALSIWDRLVETQPVHSSPVEHQATPITKEDYDAWLTGGTVRDGISHMDRDGYLWSGNFQGFLQHRKLVPFEAVW